MLEQYKQVFTKKYNNEIEKFNNLKSQIDEYEKVMREDKSEDEYKLAQVELKKKYGLFKRGKKYKEEATKLKKDYLEKLRKYKKTCDECSEIKREAAKISVYNIQKKLEQLMNANSLEDLRLTEETALAAIEKANMEEI